jgi:hypothetical protein
MNTPHTPAPHWRLIDDDDFRSLPNPGQPVDKSTPHRVSMPVAGTDLEEICQADRVCMVRHLEPKAKIPSDPHSTPRAEKNPPPSGTSDPRLLQILKRWPALPEEIHSALIALVQSVSQADEF